MSRKSFTVCISEYKYTENEHAFLTVFEQFVKYIENETMSLYRLHITIISSIIFCISHYRTSYRKRELMKNKIGGDKE